MFSRRRSWLDEVWRQDHRETQVREPLRFQDKPLCWLLRVSFNSRSDENRPDSAIGGDSCKLSMLLGLLDDAMEASQEVDVGDDDESADRITGDGAADVHDCNG